MSAAAAIAAIRARLAANWTTTSIAWPREQFTRPLDGDGLALSFVSFEPDTVMSERIGVSPVYHRTGRVLLVVLEPVNAGDPAAATLRASLTALFADKQFSRIWTEIDEDNPNCGEDDSGAYSVSYVAIRWREWAGA